MIRRSAAVTLSCLASAAGLSAHVLSSGASHDGSFRDLAVIGALLIAAKLFGARLFASGRGALVVVAIAAVTALGWPFIEAGSHVAPSELFTSALWLFPVLCAAFVSVLAFAKQSIRTVRAIIADAHTYRFEPQTSFVRCAFFRYVRIKTPRVTASLRRRGPPLLNGSTALST